METPPPKDAESRKEWLRKWVEGEMDQGRVHIPLHSRLWAELNARVERAGKIATKWVLRTSVRVQDRVLDRGIDTSDTVTLPDHDQHPEWVRYQATPWHILPRALRYLGVRRDDVFLEFGCGKGRVVHQAAKQPFRRVIGVEVSPDLAENARATVAARRHQHRCRDVEIVVADAAGYRVPDDVTMAYLFYPFIGGTLDAALQNIIDSVDRHPRRVHLIYVYPLGNKQILATGRFRLIERQHSRFHLFLGHSEFATEIYETV